MASTWEWKEYDDGSGGLRKPDGSSFFSYDKATKEYIFASDAEPGFFNDGNWRYYGDREQFNLKEFAENAAVNDSINKAFEVSKNIIEIYPPTNKFPYPSYTKEEKCQHISKALDEIINAIDINGVRPEEIEALARGKDAAEYGEKALYFIRPNAEQIQAGLDWDWELGDVIKGYTIGENGECSKGELSVIKIDDMQLFDSDAEAAEQAKEDGVKLIPKKELSFGHGNDMRNYRYIDTPNNRKLLSRYISTEKKLNVEKDYIHSEEFISKFGDWEKINRLEKLKNAPTLKKDGKVVIDGTDYTDKISEMRNNEDRKGLREIMSLLKKEILGSYTAPDMDNESIDITSATMKELNRFPLNSRQIEATLYIPDLLKNGTFICNEKNEDLVTNPEIDHYSYLLNGIKIAGEDYTAKSVIAVAKDGKKYYDHKLSKIEKGRILNNLPLLIDRESLGSLPYDLNDNRLLRICQVPQMPYLEMKNGKWRPTQESIEKVRAGKLYIEQDKTQGFSSMVDESKADRIALDFRDEYNAQKAKFEPSMTYETARDVVAASGIELIGKDFDETNGKGGEVDAKLIFNRAYANARATPDVTEDISLSSVINFNNLTKQADKAFAYMNSSIEYVTGIPDHNSVSIGAENNNVSYLALLKNADFEKCVERAKKEFRNLIETAPAEEMTFNQQTFEYFKKNASVIFRSSKESLRAFWKTVEQTYVRDDIENEKENFLDSLSGSVLNTTLEIDDEKTVRQYFVYTNKNLPGIKQEYDKDGNLASDLRLVVDIDDKTNEIDNISIDRINSVTGDVDYDVQVELSNDGKKILHTAEKEIKEYLLNEVAKQEKDFKIENIDDGNDSAQGIADKEANEKFGYSWQDKTDALSDLLDAHGEVTAPDGHPTDLDHMIHYFEENTPLEGHRRNLEKAVSHMLMFTIDDFKSLSPAKYDYISQDGAAAEVRGELCDRIANDLVSGKINNSWFEINKEVETYSKKLARREVEKQAAVQKETVKEDVFCDFVNKVEAEYKDLNLFLRSASNILKQLPPEKKDEVRKELLKRGANTPEKLAVVMRNAIKAKQNSKSQQPKNAQKKRDDYGMER